MKLHWVLIQALGGLGLFIYGMKQMSQGLQLVAGHRLRNFLEKISSNRVFGFITGALVTATIQSSSATTVTVVGFVSAGLLSLTQAVGVNLGANVGTTITAQIIAFKISDLALPAIFVGVGLHLFSRRRKWRYIGQVILGFGLLFFGMEMMKNGFKPLRSHPEFIAFFTRFDASSLWGILLCVLTGTVLTMLVQSSSATVGITMALASQGLLNLPGSIALILGDNIGTTITAELASIGSSLNAKRAARANTMFNVIGVAYIVILFTPFTSFVDWVTGSLMGIAPAEQLVEGAKPNIARYIANAHTMFNVINAGVFLFALPLLTKAAVLLTPGKEGPADEDLERLHFIDYHFVDNPSVALAQARDEIVRMARMAEAAYQGVTEVVLNRRVSHLRRWVKNEEALDRLQRSITDFLVQVSQSNISDEDSRQIASLIRMVNNFERVGDAVENIGELAEELVENTLAMSQESLDEYQQMRQKVAQFLQATITAVDSREKEIMASAQEMEEEVNQMREDMRDAYHDRLRTGVCLIDPGLIFMDLLTNFEKIGDYCFNIAQAVAGQR